MIVQNLNRIHVRCRDSGSRNVVLAAKQIHPFNVKTGYVFPEILYASGLLDIDSREPFQSIFECVVRPCGVCGDGIRECVAPLMNRRSTDDSLFNADLLLFQREVACRSGNGRQCHRRCLIAKTRHRDDGVTIPLNRKRVPALVVRCRVTENR